FRSTPAHDDRRLGPNPPEHSGTRPDGPCTDWINEAPRTFSPFRKGGVGGISAEYPDAPDAGCLTCCEMLAAQEYGPAGVPVSNDYVCPNPPLSPFTKGGEGRACQLPIPPTCRAG